VVDEVGENVAASMTDPTCIFCQIVAGDADVTLLYEDDSLVVFLDINPVTPGHTLVVPRAHMPALSDVDPRTGAHMFNVAQRMAKALRASGLRCEGVNLFYADGEAAFQEVFHAHLHVFPRYDGDGFSLVADWETQPSRTELETTGEQIRTALEAMDTGD
jgi:diadenosine tetraphosphate (Ap4A) HIT family hydrolase